MPDDDATPALVVKDRGSFFLTLASWASFLLFFAMQSLYTDSSSMTETASTTTAKPTEAPAAAVAGAAAAGAAAAAAVTTPEPLDEQPASSPCEGGDSSKATPALSPSTWKPNAAAAEWTPSFGAPAAPAAKAAEGEGGEQGTAEEGEVPAGEKVRRPKVPGRGRWFMYLLLLLSTCVIWLSARCLLRSLLSRVFSGSPVSVPVSRCFIRCLYLVFDVSWYMGHIYRHAFLLLCKKASVGTSGVSMRPNMSQT